MHKHYTTIDGFFGQKIHYDENGNYAGESWPGLFEGSYEHYNADGQYAGYSDRGIFAEQVHHRFDGQYLGETWEGITPGHKIHYDANGYAGDSWETLLSAETNLNDEIV